MGFGFRLSGLISSLSTLWARRRPRRPHPPLLLFLPKSPRNCAPERERERPSERRRKNQSAATLLVGVGLFIHSTPSSLPFLVRPTPPPPSPLHAPLRSTQVRARLLWIQCFPLRFRLRAWVRASGSVSSLNPVCKCVAFGL